MRPLYPLDRMRGSLKGTVDIPVELLCFMLQVKISAVSYYRDYSEHLFSWTRNLVHHHVHMSLLLYPHDFSLSQPVSLRFILISFYLHPGLFEFFHLKFSVPFLFPHVFCMFFPIYHSWCYHSYNISWRVQIVKLLT